ncbi:SGNH/GDSL hydrolase family protein [Nocardioides sp. SYSU D00065]|uniref:SGNH/GDSL hydrolase family protein n=1 Tax=Nocardioides sp. SYSU D00065 TaxID=2817378 RepID=UPI001B320A05|nr:SGNH/GDSL hydrolase family protein [Nocardioides sp. SYSU D00065]
MTTRMALLGDSIAWGQGAAHEHERLGPRLVRGLGLRDVDVELETYAVPGARSSGLAVQVDAALRRPPAVGVIVIGANDLTHREPVDRAVHALADAVRRLRAAGCEVVVAPAPDLSAVPHVPLAMRAVVRAAGDAFRERQVAAVSAEGAHVADPDQRASRAFATDPSLFSADRFHPSSAGYAVIADALLPAVEAAVRTAHVQ